MTAAILIPAYNEEGVIARNLKLLLEGLRGDVRVLVLCNGCCDATVEEASQFRPRVEVFDIERPSKTHAMNHGEMVLSSTGCGRGARVFMDADIELSGLEMNRLLEVLESEGTQAAEPRARFVLEMSSLPLRLFHAVWTGLHSSGRGDLGGGICGVSASGRSRFGEFPDIIADDAYLRAHFTPDEIQCVEDACTVVFATRTLRDHVRVHARVRAGIYELQAKFPALWHGKRRATRSLPAKAAALKPHMWALTPFYLVVQLCIRRRARRLFTASDPIPWEKDQRER